MNKKEEMTRLACFALVMWCYKILVRIASPVMTSRWVSSQPPFQNLHTDWVPLIWNTEFEGFPHPHTVCTSVFLHYAGGIRAVTATLLSLTSLEQHRQTDNGAPTHTTCPVSILGTTDNYLQPSELQYLNIITSNHFQRQLCKIRSRTWIRQSHYWIGSDPSLLLHRLWKFAATSKIRLRDNHRLKITGIKDYLVTTLMCVFNKSK